MSIQPQSTEPNQPSEPTPGRAPGPQQFRIQALADPAVLSRVLELFVLRDLLPSEVHCRQDGPDGEEMHISVVLAEMCPHQADHLAARMRNIIPITRVILDPA